MGHGALADPQPLGLGHAAHEVDVEAELVVDQVEVHDARGGVAELSDVGPEEHRQVRLEHRDARLLQVPHPHVDVRDAAAADDVAQPVDRQEAQRRVARVVHERDVRRDGVVRQGPERRRRDVPREGARRLLYGAGAPALVLVRPGELVRGARGRAQRQRQDEVDLAHHLVLGRGEGLGGGLGVPQQAPQRQRVLAQLGHDDVVQGAARHGVPGVRVQGLRYEAVLVDEVVHHVPLAAVADGVGEDALHEAAVEVFGGGGLDDVLEEEIRLLELVPEEQVGLRQLEGLEVVALHQRDPEHVGRREEPASARRPLVRDRRAFEGDLYVEYLLVGDLGRAGCQDVLVVRGTES